MNELWYNRYRPDTLDAYIWQSERMREQVTGWISDPSEMPHLLLAGPPGTGKTSLARLIPTLLGVETYDTLFIPASQDNGIGMIREKIIGFAEIGGFSAVKIIILDEAERLTKDAQESLRNVIDAYGKHCRFIMTCNDLSQIIDPLQSRLLVYEFKPVEFDAYVDYMLDILVQENIDLDNEATLEAFDSIIQQTYPDFRRGLNRLQNAKNGSRLVLETDKSLNVIDRFLERKTGIGELRKTLFGMDGNHLVGIYRYLYQNTERLFPNQEPEAILAIANYLDQHSRATLPDVTICAALVELREMVE